MSLYATQKVSRHSSKALASRNAMSLIFSFRVQLDSSEYQKFRKILIGKRNVIFTFFR